MTGDVVCLRTAANPVEASTWRTALEEANIPCRVVGDYLDAGIGDIPGFQAELWVPRNLVEKAEEILAHHTSHHSQP